MNVNDLEDELSMAAYNGKITVIKKLIKEGMTPDKYTMAAAVENRYIKIIEFLHKIKTPVDIKLILEKMYANECHYNGDETYIYEEDVEILRLLFKWEREQEKIL